MDESFRDVILLAEQEIQIRDANKPTRLTKLMDRDIGLLAEVAVWDHAISKEQITRLFKHGADTYGRVPNN